MTPTDDKERLNALELEARVDSHIQMSESGLFELDPKLDVTAKERELVESSLHYLNCQTNPVAPEAGGLLKAGAADGYKPELGWSRGWTQWSLAINGKTTSELVGAAAMGAGIAAIVGQISAALAETGVTAPVAVIAAIAAGALTLEAGYLQLQNTRSGNHGVYWWGLNGSILLPPALAAEASIVWTRKKK